VAVAVIGDENDSKYKHSGRAGPRPSGAGWETSHFHPRARRGHFHSPATGTQTKTRMSKKSKTKKTEGMPNKTDQSLEREADAIARRYGDIIGRDGMWWAAEQFEPTPESFDENGKLTYDGAYQLIQIMGESAWGIADNNSGVLNQMTRAELNIMRKADGLPPLSTGTEARSCGDPPRRSAPEPDDLPPRRPASAPPAPRRGDQPARANQEQHQLIQHMKIESGGQS
jgi:hypothetical protein